MRTLIMFTLVSFWLTSITGCDQQAQAPTTSQSEVATFNQEELEAAAEEVLVDLEPYVWIGEDGSAVLDADGFRVFLATEDPDSLAALDGEAAINTARQYVVVQVVSTYESDPGSFDAHEKGIVGWVLSKIWSKLSCSAAKSYAESNGYTCPGWAPPFPSCIPWYVALCAQSAGG